MNQGEITFMNFASLLHFAKEGGVLFAPCHQEKATRFAVEPADEGEKFIGVLVAKPVDQGERSVGSGGVNEPAGRFIHDEEMVVLLNNCGRHTARILPH